VVVATVFKASESTIVHAFQSFYYDLLRQKEKALSTSFSSSSKDPETEIAEDEESNKASSEIEALIVSIQKRLISVIEETISGIYVKSRLHTKTIEEAKYIMTVLADEVFINMRWDGAKFWRFSLLEKQLFKSEIAGEKFFNMLDEAMGNISEMNQELIFLYFMALSVGFKGKFRDLEKAEEYISWYKDKLYSLLHRKNTRLFYPGRYCLIEPCYSNTIRDDNKSMLPDARFWSLCIMGVAAIYIVISYIVWFDITDEILRLLNNISEQVRNGPLV
jgi:type VI secretion system protein ImpK